MTSLHQMQMQYDAHQDRGMLRIRTRDGAEFRFWLTRRYVKALWPVVRELLEADNQVQAQDTDRDRRTVLSFQHENAISRSDFTTRYDETVSRRPLGSEPVLLARVQVKSNGDGGRIICLLPREGQGIQLSMDDRLLHSFASLIDRTSRLAGWDIDIGIRATRAPEVPRAQLN